MPFLEMTDYRDFLRDEMERRSSRNTRYSLRAFARDLRLTPSHLSGILAGRAGLSKTGAIAISKEISLNSQETELFVQSVDSLHARSRAAKIIAEKKLALLRTRFRRVKPLDRDRFRMISDWYHFALLELTYLKDFKPGISWISHSLSIAPILAHRAVERLQRHGLLDTSGEKWLPLEESTETETEVPSEAIRKFHSQLLQRAGDALRLQALGKRDFRTTILAIRLDKLAEAKKMLENFHRDFCEEISPASAELRDKEQVYCLATQFFSLTPSLEKTR